METGRKVYLPVVTELLTGGTRTEDRWTSTATEVRWGPHASETCDYAGSERVYGPIVLARALLR